MTFSLPKVYPITDISITKLSHLEQVERLIAGGVKFIQLRDKNSTPNDFYKAAKAVIDFTRGKDVKIIINDRVDIALVIKADGVHLGQDDLPPENARRILGEKAIIGFSTHNISQAIEAIKMPLDYIAIGPIYATSTKENPDPMVGLEGLKIVRQAIGDFPLVAIGGINSENANEVLRNGADSVAVISQILREPARITETFREFVKHL
jgi:thiamine-phosphate pyrophosphorylase